MTRDVLSTYNLQLLGPGPIAGHERGRTGEFERYEGIRPSLLREVEENLTKLLPDGYSVRISEWYEEDEPGPKEAA